MRSRLHGPQLFVIGLAFGSRLARPFELSNDMKRPSSSPLLHRESGRLELKSAYLVAFATLGHSYILGSGLDIVRSFIGQTNDPGRMQVCMRFAGLPATQRVRVAVRPVECVVVTHETRHRLDDSGHVLVLPLPGSPPDFYERLGTLRLLLRHTHWEFCDEYQEPPARRLPMHWDGDVNLSHPFRSNQSWTSAQDTESGQSFDRQIEIRLASETRAP